MGKISLLMAVLAVLMLSSCKKSYECSCTGSSITVYEALKDINDNTENQEFQDYIDDQNDDAEDAAETSTYTNVTSLEETSKASVNGVCNDSEISNYHEESYFYYDNNTATYENIENAVGVTTTGSISCTAEKL